MSKSIAPNMHVFDSVVRDDHSMFDACLVRLCDEKSNWTKSNLRGDVPVTLEHFQYDTQRKLANHLRKIPELEKQDFSDRRIILQHIAYWFTILSAKYIHTWQEPMKEMILAIRTNLNLVTNYKRIVLQGENHPLRNHFKVKYDTVHTYEDEDNLRIAYLPAKPEDTKITSYIVGPNPGNNSSIEYTEKILSEISPFLTEIDDTQLTIQLRAVRNELRQLLESRQLFTTSLREKMIKTIMSDWREIYFGEDNSDLFDKISEEIRSTTGIDDIFNCSESDVLRECITNPLSSELDEESIKKLIHRKPVLEYLMWHALEQENFEMLNKIYDAIMDYMQKLELEFGDIGHLGLITYASICPDPKKYARILG